MADTALTEREQIEADLVGYRLMVETLEDQVGRARASRDAAILRLRRLPGGPSARTVAALAGVTDTWVLKLEKRSD